MEVASGWNPLAISAKKLPLRYLTGLQVRKIVDDTDNKRSSKLTYEVHSEIGQTPRTEIFPKQSTTLIGNFSTKNSTTIV